MIGYVNILPYVAYLAVVSSHEPALFATSERPTSCEDTMSREKLWQHLHHRALLWPVCRPRLMGYARLDDVREALWW